jgi:D-xylose transport system substrate-binding protein
VSRFSFKATESKARRLGLVLLLALVTGLALVAAGCGGDDDDDEGAADTGAGDTGEAAAGGACDSSIWVLLPDSATSPRWESEDRPYLDQAFTEAGVEHTIVNAEGDAATQQSQAEQAINDGASVIILASIDTGSGGTIIDIAKEAGVQVIEYDRFNTGSSGGAAYVSFDNVKVGATMAEVLEPIIDDLGGTPRVMMLNGGEEDNNAFLFRDGYAATVEAKVDAGEWELVDDQFVPGWGANGEGQQIMEQVLADNNNKVDAVFAANDNLATQAINALEAAGVGPVPLSGQDATAAGIQQIILGKQTMTVYKPIQAEADVAAKAALALCAGEDPTAIDSEFEFTSIGIQAEDGKPTDTATGEGIVPYLAETPIGVTEDNIMETVIADEFLTIDEICTGDTADTDFCKENG